MARQKTRFSAAAKRFVNAQRRQADYSSLASSLRSTLQALAEWNNEVLPYIQDLPLRVHALLLYMARESGNGIRPNAALLSI